MSNDLIEALKESGILSVMFSAFKMVNSKTADQSYDYDQARGLDVDTATEIVKAGGVNE